MVSNEEEHEIEKFIRPTRCLYSDNATTIDKFKDEHGVLLNNYELEDLGEDVEYKLYAEFSKDGDGELARELVQTWICDNRLELTNCIHIALNNRKQAFCDWFHDSEQHTSPDELLLYCFGRQNRLHVSIFNNKYVWSTLANHIQYDYSEILEHSQVILVFLGERHYAIFRKKGNPVHNESSSKSNKTSRSRSRGCGRGSNTRMTTKKKTVCRSSNKKSQSVSPVGKHSQTLKSARKERFGIGSESLAEVDVEKYGRGKRRKGQTIDYLKLNEGEEDLDSTPVPPKRIKHVPVRSEPTLHRQSAQKQVTESPVVTTLSTVKSKKSTEEQPAKITQTATTDDSLFGIQDGVSSNLAANVKLIGIPDSATLTATTEILTTSTSSCVPTSTVGINDAFLGVSEVDDLFLPDLGFSNEPTTVDVLNQNLNANVELTQDIASTEDEQDAVDALLSLSNVREIPPSANTDIDTEFGPEDNSMLVPIGGQAICEDIAPTESRLGQLEVDSEIARMIVLEEHTNLEKSDSCKQPTPLIGVPDQNVSAQPSKDSPIVQSDQPSTQSNALLGVPLDPPKAQPAEDATLTHISDNTQPFVSAPSGNKGARPKTGTKQQSDHTTGKKGSRGAFKSQLYGLHRNHPKDRAYKCQVCGKSKCSMESLNEHHRRNHDPQMCGVCGKMFDLATTLSHHMYSHYTSKYYCDKCDFHCFFKSELEAHKIVHRDQPSFQCMYPKCSRWFKRKGELSLHVESHRKIWYDCKKCDFSTKLKKYLKEHEKSHLKKNEELPYACDICGDRFMWRSGVKRHKEKKHSS